MIEHTHVLVVSDEDIFSPEIIQGLKQRDVLLAFTKDREEVLEFCLDPIPVIVLIDLPCDIKSGLEIIQMIKEKTRFTEIILLVDELNLDLVTQAINLGASNYIVKPLNENLFFAIITRAVEQYRTKQFSHERENHRRSNFEAQNDWLNSEARFRLFSSAAFEGIGITEKGKIIDANDQLADLLGFSRDELIGTHVLTYVHPEDRKFVEKKSTAQVEKPYEHRAVRKDGSIIFVEVRPRTLVIDGNTLRVTAVRDILDRKKAEAEIERRAQQLASINEMGQITTSSLDLDLVLNNVVNVVPGLVGAEGVSLLFVEDDEFVFVAVSGEFSENLKNLRMPSDTGIAGRVLLTGKPEIVRETEGRNQIYSKIDEQSGYRTKSLLAVPLILSGEVIGVMEAVHSEPEAFNLDDLSLLETAAAWTAIALRNARQHQALQRQLQESQALTSISQALNETLDLDRILDLITDSARQVIPQVERAVIHLLNEDQYLLTAIAVSSNLDMDKNYLNMRAGVGVAGQVLAQGKTINIGDTRKDPRFMPGKEKGLDHLRSLMVAPIQSGDRKLGTLSVSSEGLKAFNSTDKNLLTVLGVQAALAIESARLFEETRQRAHYLGMLTDMTNAALQIPDLKTILQSLTGQLVLLFQADSCYLNLWDQERRQVLLHTSHGPDIQDIDIISPEPGERTMTESVLNAGTVLIADNVYETPYLSPKIAAMFPSRSLMGLPLVADDQKIGAALIGFNTPHKFTPEEISLGELIARQVTLVIAKAKLLESEQQRRQEAETLREVATTITSTLEIDRVLERILTSLEQVIPFDSAGVILDMVDHLLVVAGRGFHDQAAVIGKHLPFNSPLYTQIQEGKKAIIIQDAQNDPRWINLMNLSNIRGWIGTPLLVQEQVIGYLTINNHKVGAYGEPEAALAQVFANQAAVAIQNARLYNSTRRRLKEVNTLFTINNQLVASIDFQVDEIAQQVVNMLWAEFDYYHVHIYLVDEQRKTLAVQQGSGPIGARMAVEGHQLTLDEGVVGYVATVGDAFMTNNINDVHFYIPNPMLPETRAELAVPLRASGKLLGVLDIHHQPPNKFTDDDLRLVQTVADLLAAGLEKAMLYTELHEALQMEKSIRAELIQSEKLAAMGRLVASVAHELNNPLQAIQNALYLVKMEETLSSQASEDLQVALSETTRMGNLIARLRDVYRPTSIDQYKQESLNILVDEVEKLVNTHLRHNKIAFQFYRYPDLPVVMMNRDQIKQVILNLCLNAVETMAGGGKLMIKTNYLPAESRVTLRVEDSGPGISAEIISHIFEPFFTTKEKGTGLGLFVSYEIIQNHNGEIVVESGKGFGAAFTFSLPIEKEPGLDLNERIL